MEREPADPSKELFGSREVVGAVGLLPGSGYPRGTGMWHARGGPGPVPGSGFSSPAGGGAENAAAWPVWGGKVPKLNKRGDHGLKRGRSGC